MDIIVKKLVTALCQLIKHSVVGYVASNNTVSVLMTVAHCC